MKPTIVLSGIPGRMCREIASLLMEDPYRQEFLLAEAGFSDSARAGRPVEITAGREILGEPTADLERVLGERGIANPVIVDFTTPRAALANIALYARAGIPFVVGTTGFNREQAVELVRNSATSAVIAPNMAVPVILIQAALRTLASRFPGALAGYKVSVRESHQAAKKDASGTAKAFLPMLQQLGMIAPAFPIESLRDPGEQRILGVPEEHLDGHGWHWYFAHSPVGDVRLELSHRVNGRRVYAEGALRAVAFLAGKVLAGSRGETFTMEDVLGVSGP